MDSIKLITLTPTQYHILSIAARGHGQTVEEYTAETLSRLFKGLADLKGLRPVEVTSAQITPATTPAPEQPAPVHQPAPAGSSGMFDTL